MRTLRICIAAVTFFLLARYFPVIYYAVEYNDFVKQEAQRMQVAPQLQRSLLDQAQLYFLPIKPGDIRINENDGLIRVHIDYKVPINLFVFKHELNFHATGAGLG